LDPTLHRKRTATGIGTHSDRDTDGQGKGHRHTGRVDTKVVFSISRNTKLIRN